MSQENEQTIAIYEKYADKYLEGGVKHQANQPDKQAKKYAELKEFVGQALKGLPKSAAIFEIGSSDGEAAKMFRELGHEVVLSDAPISFVEVMRQKGLSPVQFNLLTDEFPAQYDVIYAWRVFVHFTTDDFRHSCAKIFAALKPGGRFIFNILNSAGHDGLAEAWVDYEGDYAMGVERYFKYWTEEELRKVLEEADFRIARLEFYGGKQDNRWFQVVAEKPSDEEQHGEKKV